MYPDFIKNLNARVSERGGEIHPRGLFGFRVAGVNAMLLPLDMTALTDDEPAHKSAVAVIVVADFAQAANKVFADKRLSEAGKHDDVVKLTAQAGERLNALLTEADIALQSAMKAEQKDLLPVPVPGADAAQSVVDSELRSLVRAMSVGDAMRALEQEYGFLLALMRQPLGFDAGLIEYAQRLWKERNPAAQTATAAMRLATSWREARRVIGDAISAVTTLSGGRLPLKLPAVA